MAKVLLVDYPPAVRQALRTRIALEPDLEVIGEADDGPQALAAAESLDPDVVVLDAETPNLDVLGLIQALAEQDDNRGIVILSLHTAAIGQALEAWSVRVVGKHERSAALVRAIRCAARR
jgi:DNA-binding NarL/FixJ family response regulator